MFKKTREYAKEIIRLDDTDTEVCIRLNIAEEVHYRRFMDNDFETLTWTTTAIFDEDHPFDHPAWTALKSLRKEAEEARANLYAKLEEMTPLRFHLMKVLRFFEMLSKEEYEKVTQSYKRYRWYKENRQHALSSRKRKGHETKSHHKATGNPDQV